MIRVTRDLGLLLLFGAWLSACTVTATSPGLDEGPSNSCSSDSDCPRDGGSCLEGVCQTLNGRLESLLIEVTPPSDSLLPHIPFLVYQEDLPATGNELALGLTRAQRVQGWMRPPVVSGCKRTYYGQQDSELSPSTDGESMPVTVTLRPREAALGLPTQIHVADATLPTVNMQNGSIHYTFNLHVPAGSYDVYVEPVSQEIAPAVDGAEIDESCRIPPQLFRATELMAAQGAVDLVLEPHPISEVDISVEFPGAPGLDGWKVDIIDSLSGLPISTSRTLANAEAAGSLYRYRALLAYSGVGGPEAADAEAGGANDLVRLRPPAGVVAPTIILDRAGLGLFGGPGLTIKAITQVPSPVTLQGQMSGREDGAPSSGHVVLVSTDVSGIDAGIFGSYRTSAEVGKDGLFELALPPGRYRVFGVPSREDPARTLSAYETVWDVPADANFQAGKLLELPSLAQVHGQTALPGAEVRVSASPRNVLPFEELLGRDAFEFIPTAFPGLVDEAGRFVLRADPGRFNIAVQPPVASNYAWSVRPSFEVVAGVEKELGRMPSRVPWVVSGVATVRESAAVVSGALVRAYAYLDENLSYTRDPAEARSVIQVAETRTDEQGKFRLLVPEDISNPD